MSIVGSSVPSHNSPSFACPSLLFVSSSGRSARSARCVCPSARPPVRKCVRPSVRPSVRPFSTTDSLTLSSVRLFVRSLFVGAHACLSVFFGGGTSRLAATLSLFFFVTADDASWTDRQPSDVQQQSRARQSVGEWNGPPLTRVISLGGGLESKQTKMNCEPVPGRRQRGRPTQADARERISNKCTIGRAA